MRTEEDRKCSMIRHIVRIRQMLRRWRQKAAESRRSVPSDVPAGHVAVCVGSTGRRFVVRTTYLNHPLFHSLLDRAEEEYGFTNQGGPINIPCDELLFEDVIHFLAGSCSSSCSRRLVTLEDFQRKWHATGFRAISETRPLLSQ